MFQLKDTSLEWALKHIKKHSSSTFFPKSFEIEAVAHDWSKIKPYLQGLDLDCYTPKTPTLRLALKANKNFRVVHQLSPLDSIIYTALAYEVHEKIEEFRIPKSEKIACSYRIEPTIDGSFFAKDKGWKDFKDKTQELAKKYPKGVVLVCDITDFYNQIYTHRLQNIISEASGPAFEGHAHAIERFLLALNSKTSRGIPVGPQASILFAEAIMADIDKKILTYTRDFARYVDDSRIFFEKESDAVRLLHDLTKYLYSTHRLVFSGVKTRIKYVKDFLTNDFLDEEQEEEIKKLQTQEELTFEHLVRSDVIIFGKYTEVEEIVDSAAFQTAFEEVGKTKKFEILMESYKKILESTLKSTTPDFRIIKYILWKAIEYNLKDLGPIVIKYFEVLLPLIKEVCIFLNKVITEKNISKYDTDLAAILNSEYAKIPLINTWLSTLFQNKAFKKSSVKVEVKKFNELRDQALIAKQFDDKTLVKTFKDNIDSLTSEDKRAVIYSSTVLSIDEQKTWLNFIKEKDDLLDSAIAKLAMSEKAKSKTAGQLH